MVDTKKTTSLRGGLKKLGMIKNDGEAVTFLMLQPSLRLSAFTHVVINVFRENLCYFPDLQITKIEAHASPHGRPH